MSPTTHDPDSITCPAEYKTNNIDNSQATRPSDVEKILGPYVTDDHYSIYAFCWILDTDSWVPIPPTTTSNDTTNNDNEEFSSSSLWIDRYAIVAFFMSVTNPRIDLRKSLSKSICDWEEYGTITCNENGRPIELLFGAYFCNVFI